jgi:hypothetical protein
LPPSADPVALSAFESALDSALSTSTHPSLAAFESAISQYSTLISPFPDIPELFDADPLLASLSEAEALLRAADAVSERVRLEAELSACNSAYAAALSECCEAVFLHCESASIESTVSSLATAVGDADAAAFEREIETALADLAREHLPFAVRAREAVRRELREAMVGGAQPSPELAAFAESRERYREATAERAGLLSDALLDIALEEGEEGEALARELAEAATLCADVESLLQESAVARQAQRSQFYETDESSRPLLSRSFDSLPSGECADAFYSPEALARPPALGLPPPGRWEEEDYDSLRVAKTPQRRVPLIAGLPGAQRKV